MSETLGDCCISGVSHDGTPTGTMRTINGTPVYVALPTGTYDKTKALLFFPDVFGLELPNNRLLCDDYGRAGFATYLVDYLVGDPIPADALNPTAEKPFDLMAWIGKHGADVTRPQIDNVLKGLKDEGVKEFAATGFCFGGKYVMSTALSQDIKVGIVAHPSLLTIPDELEALKKVSIPFLWNTCETDFMYPPEKQAIADEVFKGDKNYKRDYYTGVAHGFAVRGDMSNPVEKAAKEGAFKGSVDFLKAHF